MIALNRDNRLSQGTLRETLQWVSMVYLAEFRTERLTIRELIAADEHATPVTDADEKRRISRVILDRVGRTEQLEERIKGSPLMHIVVVIPED